MELAYRITKRGGTTVTAGLPHPDHRWELQHTNLTAEERTVKGVTWVLVYPTEM